MKVQINLSEQNKAFIWTPMKTSSMHAHMIFSLFGFEYFFCSYDRSEIYAYEEFPKHTNYCDLFLGHENYILISTARNPIHKIFSAYLFMEKKEVISKEGFRKFFSQQNSIFQNTLTTQISFKNRKADYYLRVENLFEDYCKIPFIRQSKIYESGALKELCDRKKNYSKSNFDIREFYTEDMIDFVFRNNKEYFEHLGYEPIL